MKKFVLFLSCCLLICFLAACQKEINSITDFPKFSDMTQDGTESINVEFDVGGDCYEFIIEDEEAINEVMEIIFTLEFSKGHTEPLFPGVNTRITIHQGGEGVQYVCSIYSAR